MEVKVSNKTLLSDKFSAERGVMYEEGKVDLEFRSFPELAIS